MQVVEERHCVSLIKFPLVAIFPNLSPRMTKWMAQKWPSIQISRHFDTKRLELGEKTTCLIYSTVSKVFPQAAKNNFLFNKSLEKKKQLFSQLAHPLAVIENSLFVFMHITRERFALLSLSRIKLQSVENAINNLAQVEKCNLSVKEARRDKWWFI